MNLIKKYFNKMEEQYLTATEAAAFLRITMANLYKLTMAKTIPFYKPTKKLYFKKAELIDYINQAKQGRNK